MNVAFAAVVIAGAWSTVSLNACDPAVFIDCHTTDGSYHRYGLTYEGGALTLLVDGDPMGTETLPGSLPFRWQIGGGQLLIGRDAGFPVCDDYEPPFPFTGELRTLTVEIPMYAPRDPSEEVATALRSE